MQRFSSSAVIRDAKLKHNEYQNTKIKMQTSMVGNSHIFLDEAGIDTALEDVVYYSKDPICTKPAQGLLQLKTYINRHILKV